MGIYLVFIIGAVIVSRSQGHAVDYLKFPDDLLLGAASSSYQVEGAWNEDGKGENIWDRMTHANPEKIDDRSTGDIACDAYHKTKEDIALMKDLGLQFYRFSISWSRILPTGFPNKINQAGIDYYNDLINQLLANNIIPMVTVYHWDLPQPLQDLGGFANPEIINWLKDYAKVVFDHFGDRVKTWITINEPKQICEFGYGTGMFAPGLQAGGIGNYLCTHNLLKAHAHIYHMYDKIYRRNQKGHIGITAECSWSEPATNATQDIEAAERRRQFDFGMYMNPIFHKNGDYPAVVKQFVAKRSKEEGFPRSRLPEFTQQEINFIKGTSDFFGLNHYTTVLVKDKKADPIGDPSQDKDTRVETFQDPNWLTGSFSYFRSVPWGLRKALNYIKHNYGNPEILITENGFPDAESFNDQGRIRYYKDNLKAVLDAIYTDHVRITVYTAWSLMDNFEWSSGYTVRFGLYHVDFNDTNRPRTPKESVKFYKNLIKTRRLNTEDPKLP
ncbi:hypothetical protein ILUMI_03030 [Ignelater luminosus]|uniref:Beta-glucosidase n=1 Tax=Ignelater luminosus TaxID=2038154 RepID=A0A8K0DMM9_IGNLU|nr:hypothetical protein ILUMI_03030 [Ignelater luminosus]